MHNQVYYDTPEHTQLNTPILVNMNVLFTPNTDNISGDVCILLRSYDEIMLEYQLKTISVVRLPW